VHQQLCLGLSFSSFHILIFSYLNTETLQSAVELGVYFGDENQTVSLDHSDSLKTCITGTHLAKEKGNTLRTKSTVRT